MPRPKLELNPIRGKRLKQIIREKGISQQALSKTIHISQQAISAMVNERANLTETTAKAVIKLYPEYRYEWLMGYDDFKTRDDMYLSKFSERFKAVSNQMDFMNCVFRLNGYIIKYIENDPNVPNIEFEKDYYAIFDGSNMIAKLSIEEFQNLNEELSNYSTYCVNRAIERSKSKKQSNIN